MSEIEIYSGRRALGIVQDRNGKWEAFDDEFEPLGAFPTQQKTEAAVLEAIAAKDAARAG